MRPRIVFAAPQIPYPPDNGWNQRMLHILKILAGIGNVDLVCYANYGQDSNSTNLSELLGVCDSVHIFEMPEHRWAQPPRTSRDLIERFILSRKPVHVAEFPGQPLADRVAKLASQADLIWAVRLYLAEWLQGGLDRTIVDLDDLVSEAERKRLALRKGGAWTLLSRLEISKLRRLERSAPRRYAGVVVCSEKDRGFFPARDADRVFVVPNGIPAHLLDRPRPDDQELSIVLVGYMRYDPNVDAALWFTREIFPKVKAMVPGVRLYLIGDDIRGRLRPLHDGERVIVTGRVDDVTSYVSRAAVSVVPIRWGGGTRIKILESLALGTPVVSTTVGAEGLDLIPGAHVQIADSPESFAEAVILLLQNQQARAALVSQGGALVRDRFTWDRIGCALKSSLEAWLSAREARGAGALATRGG
jgi:glycosyltransferase involved in cell wall biosynthesis